MRPRVVKRSTTCKKDAKQLVSIIKNERKTKNLLLAQMMIHIIWAALFAKWLICLSQPVISPAFPRACLTCTGVHPILAGALPTVTFPS